MSDADQASISSFDLCLSELSELAGNSLSIDSEVGEHGMCRESSEHQQPQYNNVESVV